MKRNRRHYADMGILLSKNLKKKNVVVLTHLRIGHTRLIQGYLMCNTHDSFPLCEQCNIQLGLSVKHILYECPIYTVGYDSNKNLIQSVFF